MEVEDNVKAGFKQMLYIICYKRTLHYLKSFNSQTLIGCTYLVVISALAYVAVNFPNCSAQPETRELQSNCSNTSDSNLASRDNN